MARNIENIVNQQVRRWDSMRLATEPSFNVPPKNLVQKCQKPMITISREMGSLGTSIARGLAEKLDFQLYDKELVDLIAEQANIRGALVESVDERMQDAMDNWIAEQFGIGAFAHSDYLEELSRVLLTLGRHGQGIIIGRGASFILDPKHTLSIRIIAPLDLRIERMGEREGLNTREARALVLRVDSERSAFRKRHFNQKSSPPLDYDFVFNTASYTVTECIATAEAAFKVRFG
ncbi:cytidylate kinase-like family protein [Myxococcota bacterium]|nr:cytidylate kinase-like family protein [Myxococcota bacterium]